MQNTIAGLLLFGSVKSSDSVAKSETLNAGTNRKLLLTQYRYHAYWASSYGITERNTNSEKWANNRCCACVSISAFLMPRPALEEWQWKPAPKKIILINWAAAGPHKDHMQIDLSCRVFQKLSPLPLFFQKTLPNRSGYRSWAGLKNQCVKPRAIRSHLNRNFIALNRLNIDTQGLKRTSLQSSKKKWDEFVNHTEYNYAKPKNDDKN